MVILALFLLFSSVFSDFSRSVEEIKPMSPLFDPFGLSNNTHISEKLPKNIAIKNEHLKKIAFIIVFCQFFGCYPISEFE